MREFSQFRDEDEYVFLPCSPRVASTAPEIYERAGPRDNAYRYRALEC